MNFYSCNPFHRILCLLCYLPCRTFLCQLLVHLNLNLLSLKGLTDYIKYLSLISHFLPEHIKFEILNCSLNNEVLFGPIAAQVIKMFDEAGNLLRKLLIFKPPASISKNRFPFDSNFFLENKTTSTRQELHQTMARAF